MKKTLLTLLLCNFFFAGSVLAKIPSYTTTIKNHRFHPDLIKVPKGQKFKLIVKNEDSTAEEFESHDLNREKIIPGNRRAIFIIAPLEPGFYKFFGEFNKDTAQGVVEVF